MVTTVIAGHVKHIRTTLVSICLARDHLTVEQPYVHVQPPRNHSLDALPCCPTIQS